jgi:hypothetical protein
LCVDSTDPFSTFCTSSTSSRNPWLLNNLHVHAISPTTPLFVSLCSLSCIFHCTVCAPCAPCLFLVLFACILGGFHAPPCRVSSLCSLPVPCALRLYFRRYSCSFILQARGRPLQIAVARSDSSSGCAVTRPHPSPQFLKGPQEALAEQLGRHCVCSRDSALEPPPRDGTATAPRPNLAN